MARTITFPQIKPIVVILLIYNVLVGVTSFDVTYALTAGIAGEGRHDHRQFALVDLFQTRDTIRSTGNIHSMGYRVRCGAGAAMSVFPVAKGPGA